MRHLLLPVALVLVSFVTISDALKAKQVTFCDTRGVRLNGVARELFGTARLTDDYKCVLGSSCAPAILSTSNCLPSIIFMPFVAGIGPGVSSSAKRE